MERAESSDFNAWVTDSKKLAEFKDLCHQKLKPPAIIGNDTFFGPAEQDITSYYFTLFEK